MCKFLEKTRKENKFFQPFTVKNEFPYKSNSYKEFNKWDSVNYYVKSFIFSSSNLQDYKVKDLIFVKKVKI